MPRHERIALGGCVYAVLKRDSGRLHLCRRRGHRAFTLAELLVVLAIIAVLMAILAVALRGARKQAQEIKRRSDLRQGEIARALKDRDDR